MYILYFDMCAAIILVTFIFSNISRKMTSGTQNKFFMSLLLITLLADVFDIWAVTMDVYATPESHCSWGVMCFAFTGYFLFHNLTIVVYLLLIISLCDTWHKLKKNKPLAALASIPTVITILALITNVFTQNIFHFNEQNHYERGSHLYILYICAFVNMIICLVYLFKFRKLFSRDKFIALFSMLPLELCAVAIQLFYPKLLVEMFANTVAIFLLGTVAQRPEELLDSVTSLGKHDAYAVNMKKNFANEKPVAIIMVNVSNFMSLQKILNFDGSNEMLQKIAQGLNVINREQKARAEIYYLDNGRFSFVMDEEHRKLVDITAERIDSFMKQSMRIGELELNLVTYVCVAKIPGEIRSFKALIQFERDFHEKYEYTGRVMYVPDLIEQSTMEFTKEIDEIIDNAIAKKFFKVYYQPIYSVKEKKFTSAEALIRLIDDRFGFISPDIFVPAAERSGAINRIGAYVIEEICRFIASDDFKRTGLKYIEVNLSVAQCMQVNLAEEIFQTMDKYGVAPDKINFEITETAANYSQDIMMANIDKLHSKGLCFSLDDYGTGYSNLDRITSLPLTIVKLDKSFVCVGYNSKMWIVLQNTIKMLKEIHMHIVVEGVETQQNLDRFIDLQCDYIQGYYFSKPIPEREFVDFLIEKNAVE